MAETDLKRLWTLLDEALDRLDQLANVRRYRKTPLEEADVLETECVAESIVRLRREIMLQSPEEEQSCEPEGLVSLRYRCPYSCSVLSRIYQGSIVDVKAIETHVPKIYCDACSMVHVTRLGDFVEIPQDDPSVVAGNVTSISTC